MATQDIKQIKVSALKLWSENPRDPIDPKSSDFDIIQRAVDQNPSVWNLDKMVKEMGNHYDFSEIPTVVYLEGAPVVFDGNRRVAVLKYLQDRTLYSSLTGKLFPTNNTPKELVELKEIPCNVCDKDTALTNIERKHVSNGSWGTLQREYFLHRHRGQPKSLFLILEEQTKLISSHPALNQGFVKDEVLTEKNLKEIGFGVRGDQLVSNYEDAGQKEVLEQASALVESKEITTRKNRGSLKQTLLQKYPDSKKILTAFDNTKKVKVVDHEFTATIRKTPRLNGQEPVLFSKNLSLKAGDTNNLYRDITDLYFYYRDNRTTLSKSFCALIRMSLRLIVESATTKNIDDYVNRHFNRAKKSLTQDQKTTLSTQEVDTAAKLIKLLHVGAHKYISSANMEQTMAMSIIIGVMLEVSHARQGRSKKKKV
jgi:hypothetical protein